jgi:hypothetical protein
MMEAWTVDGRRIAAHLISAGKVIFNEGPFDDIFFLFHNSDVSTIFVRSAVLNWELIGKLMTAGRGKMTFFSIYGHA